MNQGDRPASKTACGVWFLFLEGEGKGEGERADRSAIKALIDFVMTRYGKHTFPPAS